MPELHKGGALSLGVHTIARVACCMLAVTKGERKKVRVVRFLAQVDDTMTFETQGTNLTTCS